MKLPNGDRAVIDIRKLADYCLDTHHPRGRNKARVLAAVGVHQADAERQRDAPLGAANNTDAQPGRPSPYGQRYVVDFDWVRDRRTVKVCSTWIVRVGEDVPRLTTCYVLWRGMDGMGHIGMLSVVALIEDLPEQGLVGGQVGTVVENWAPGVYEIEFCDDSGGAYAMVALKAEQLMRLHHAPAHQAA
jgi:hypothetical protein